MTNSRFVTKRHLKNGTLFNVYQNLSYSDDLTGGFLLFPCRPVRGVYFVPLRLSRKSRSTPCAIRTLKFSLAGVRSNLVLDYIIGDSEMAVKKDVPSFDALERKRIIFVEVVGYVTDYPQSAAVVDILDHTAHPPCIHCSICSLCLANDSNYAYTAPIHSASSVARVYWHTKTHRAADLSTKSANCLGRNSGSISVLEEPGAAHLLKLAKLLKENRQQAQETNHNVLVVPCNFEPYIANCIARDHLLCGIVKGLLSPSFALTRDLLNNIKLDICLYPALRRVGVYGGSLLFNVYINTI